MSSVMYGLDELDFEEARRERRIKRMHESMLASHPDCRDPDHPGCERCCEDEQENDDAQALN